MSHLDDNNYETPRKCNYYKPVGCQQKSMMKVSSVPSHDGQCVNPTSTLGVDTDAPTTTDLSCTSAFNSTRTEDQVEDDSSITFTTSSILTEDRSVGSLSTSTKVSKITSSGRSGRTNVSATATGTATAAAVDRRDNPRWSTTGTGIAVQMSTLQASFAEKTAEEMKQVIDWYNHHHLQGTKKKNNGLDLDLRSMQKEFDSKTKAQQKQTNLRKASSEDALVSAFQEDDDRTAREPSMASSDCKKRLADNDEASIKMIDEPSKSFSIAKSASMSQSYRATFITPRKLDSSIDVSSLKEPHQLDNHEQQLRAEDPPTMVESPTAFDSPSSSTSSNSTSDTDDDQNGMMVDLVSTKEAYDQTDEVQDLVIATRFMAEIVQEYEQSASGSDSDQGATRKTKASHNVGYSHGYEEEKSQTKNTNFGHSKSNKQKRQRRRYRRRQLIVGCGSFLLFLLIGFLVWHLSPRILKDNPEKLVSPLLHDACQNDDGEQVISSSCIIQGEL